MIALVQISWRLWQCKNFENQPGSHNVTYLPLDTSEHGDQIQLKVKVKAE